MITFWQRVLCDNRAASIANFLDAASRASIDATFGGLSAVLSRPMIHLPFSI
jgi:hypothetical protein